MKSSKEGIEELKNKGEREGERTEKIVEIQSQL